MGELRPIEGGRAIAARDAQASFAVDCTDITVQLENLSVYVVFAWDDEGKINTAYFMGPRNPFSPAMVPYLIRARLVSQIANGGTD